MVHSHSGSTPPPAVFSTPRIATLLSSLLVSLASGTNYVFSAYGPQLSSRLHLTHTQQNIVGLAGNIGVYSTAPIWGRIVDTKGPKPLLVLGFVSLLIGYNGIRYFYDAGLPGGDATTSLGVVAFCALVVCSFLTGIGGNGGLASAMNATAKSFPDGARATVTGLVISGFGLSAFLFSTIAHLVFPGNTSDFLLLLAIGTSLPMVLGFFYVRPIPLPHHTHHHHHEGGYEHVREDANESEEDEDDVIFSVETPPVSAGGRDHGHSRTNLLDSPPDAGSYNLPSSSHSHSSHSSHSSDEDDEEDEDHNRSPSGYIPPDETGLALSPTRSSRHRSRSSFSSSVRHRKVGGGGGGGGGTVNVRGKALVGEGMFWVLFVTTSLLSGTGLMYINNVGSISQALFAKGDPEFDERKASQWQATQVSTVSVANCLGRVLIGIIADFTKNNLHRPRSWCMALVSGLFIVSQVTVFHIGDVRDLWRGSALLGLAYGGLFGLFPTLVIEWFGLAHFSENWGFVSLSPLIGGNVFSIAFGRNLDAHAPSEPQDALNLADASHQCLLGRECYAGSLLMTIAACSTALCLSVYAGWRDWGRVKREERGYRRSVVWDAEED